MRRAERRYRGRKPAPGLGAGQIGMLAIILLVLMLALTIRANCHWTGMDAGEQLHQAVFVAKDWD